VNNDELIEKVLVEAEPSGLREHPVTVETLPDLLSIYANQVSLIRTDNELFVDFYAVEPTSTSDAIARHVSRIVLPLTAMKGLRDAIEEQIAGYEHEFGINLPNLWNRRKKGR
jgi:hypothetical protein